MFAGAAELIKLTGLVTVVACSALAVPPVPALAEPGEPLAVDDFVYVPVTGPLYELFPADGGLLVRDNDNYPDATSTTFDVSQVSHGEEHEDGPGSLRVGYPGGYAGVDVPYTNHGPHGDAFAVAHFLFGQAVPTDDVARTRKNMTVTIDVLQNDSYVGGSVLKVTSATGGVATVTAGDDVSFTPAQNFIGDASVTYQVNYPNGAYVVPSRDAAVEIHVADLDKTTLTMTGDRKVTRGRTALLHTRLDMEHGSLGFVETVTLWTTGANKHQVAAKSSSSPTFNFAVKPSKTTTYKTKYAGSKYNQPSTSNKRTLVVVEPKPKKLVAIVTYSHKTIKLGKSLTVRVNSQDTWGGTPVVLEKRVDGKWREIAAGFLNGHGNHTFSWKPKKAGKYTVRGRVAGLSPDDSTKAVKITVNKTN